MMDWTIRRDAWAYRIKREIVWLSRINRCQGFGVQSPWAYKMVRNVINGRCPKSKTDGLRREFAALDPRTRKLCELCLRLANSVKPQTAIDFGSSDGSYVAYIKAGCSETNCVSVPCDATEDDFRNLIDACRSVDMARISPYGAFRRFAELAATKVHDGSVFVIDGIHEKGNAKMLWKEILEDWQDVVTFDLYYCGLVFFDLKRFKQNYIINF